MLKKLLRGVGFSKGCAALTLKKPPPLVPELLDGLLRGDGADGEHLVGDVLARGVLGGLQQRHVVRAREGLHDALRDEDQRQDDRERQQDVERAAHEIDPEVAERRAWSCARCRG